MLIRKQCNQQPRVFEVHTYCKNKKYCLLVCRLHCIIKIVHYSTFTLRVCTLISGWTQQFVCPYIVSGLKVAATKNTFFPDNALKKKKKWNKGAESWSANQPDPVSQEGSGQEYKITKQMIWWTKISILCSSQTFSINSCTLTSLWMAHRSSSWFLCIPVGQHPFTSQKIRSAKTKFALTCSSWKKIWTLTTEKNSETLFFFFKIFGTDWKSAL